MYINEFKKKIADGILIKIIDLEDLISPKKLARIKERNSFL